MSTKIQISNFNNCLYKNNYALSYKYFALDVDVCWNTKILANTSTLCTHCFVI